MKGDKEMAKKTCLMCGREMGVMTGKVKCVDGYICSNCVKELGYSTFDTNALTSIGNMSSAQLLAKGDKKNNDIEAVQKFVPTSVTAKYAKFDDENQKMILANRMHISYKPEHYTLFSYNQLVDFELLEDGNSIASGGLGRAAVGGMLLGGVGAVVGGVTGKKKSKATCTQLRIKLTMRDYPDPAFYIDVITTETKKEGLVWKSTMQEVQNTLAKLQLITDSLSNDIEDESKADSVVLDVTEELRKYKALLDDGIITAEDFDAKKRELLGL